MGIGSKYLLKAKTMSMEQNIEKLIKDANEGNSYAQYKIGICYLHGDSVTQDYSMARFWLEKSAAQNDPNGLNGLGVLFRRGQGVPLNYEYALELFRKAADMGLAKAQSNLAMSYIDDIAKEKDYAKALFWFRKAAKQGNAIALFYIGAFYINGLVIDKNKELAVRYFTKAAKNDCTKAKFVLGELYLFGEGVERNLNKSKWWLSKALEEGYTDAAQRLAQVKQIMATNNLQYYTRGTKPMNQKNRENVGKGKIMELDKIIQIQSLNGSTKDVAICQDYLELANALFYANYEEVVSITSSVGFKKNILEAEPSKENDLPFPLFLIPQLVKIICDDEIVMSHAASIREVKGVKRADLKEIAKKRLKETDCIMKYLHNEFNIFFTPEIQFHRYAENILSGCARHFSKLKTSIDDYVERGYREIDVLLYAAGVNFDFGVMEEYLQQGASPIIELKESEHDCGIRLTEMLIEARFYASCCRTPLDKKETKISHQYLCSVR